MGSKEEQGLIFTQAISSNLVIIDSSSTAFWTSGNLSLPDRSAPPVGYLLLGRSQEKFKYLWWDVQMQCSSLPGSLRTYSEMSPQIQSDKFTLAKEYMYSFSFPNNMPLLGEILLHILDAWRAFSFQTQMCEPSKKVLLVFTTILYPREQQSCAEAA